MHLRLVYLASYFAHALKVIAKWQQTTPERPATARRFHGVVRQKSRNCLFRTRQTHQREMRSRHRTLDALSPRGTRNERGRRRNVSSPTRPLVRGISAEHSHQLARAPPHLAGHVDGCPLLRDCWHIQRACQVAALLRRPVLAEAHGARGHK